jgi:hypothetical protein
MLDKVSSLVCSQARPFFSLAGKLKDTSPIVRHHHGLPDYGLHELGDDHGLGDSLPVGETQRLGTGSCRFVHRWVEGLDRESCMPITRFPLKLRWNMCAVSSGWRWQS